MFSSAHPKYEQQIFFNLLEKSDAKEPALIKSRKYFFSKGMIVINIKPDEYGNLHYLPDDEITFEKIRQNISYRTRIYFLAHCARGSDYFSSNNGKISAQQLARFIALKIFFNLPPVAGLLPFEERIKISLLACRAGLPKEQSVMPLGCINDSFAARFLYALKIYNIKNVVIAARIGLLSLPDNNNFTVLPESKIASYNHLESRYEKALAAKNDQELKKIERELNKIWFYHKSNASKIIYYNLNEYQQAITVGYRNQITSDGWREDVMDTITNCMVNEKSPRIKNQLLGLLKEVALYEQDLDIYTFIEEILENPAKISQQNYGLMSSSASARDVLQKLIDRYRYATSF